MTPIALAEIWNAILAALPAMGLALVLVLIGWLTGRLLFAVTWRLLQRFKFDEAASRAGIAAGLEQAGFIYPPSKLFAALIHWAAFLTFGMMALEALGFDAILQPLQSLIGYLPHLLAAGVALVAGLLLAQILGRASQAALASFGLDFHEAGGRLARGLVIIVTALVALEQLNLNITILSDTFVNLLTIVVGGFTLAFALGAQGIARNILAGYYVRENLTPCDVLVVDEIEGTLEAIGVVSSEVSVQGDRFFVPNLRLVEGKVHLKTGATV
ncbi:MAG: mechanosensitive ion channel [Anaerolineales bacterium]|nr:mechanosensitive ion channel [Anaerolineales bacterium]